MSASSSSATGSVSPTWSSMTTTQRGPRQGIVRTTEKSVVFRVRTQEQVSSGREGSQHKTMYLKQSGDSSGTDDADVHETLAELYAEVERKKKWLHNEEQTFQNGRDQLYNLQREHAALLRNLEQCKQRRKERVRIQKMLHGPQAESEDYDSEERSFESSSSESDYSSFKASKRRRSSSHHRRSRRDGAKKERKKLKRFQSDVSLRFQLLKSECRRSDLQVDKLMADLRREYADSCLFGNSLNF